MGRGRFGDPWNTGGVPATNRSLVGAQQRALRRPLEHLRCSSDKPVARGHATEGALATPGTPKVFQRQTLPLMSSTATEHVQRAARCRTADEHGSKPVGFSRQNGEGPGSAYRHAACYPTSGPPAHPAPQAHGGSHHVESPSPRRRDGAQQSGRPVIGNAGIRRHRR